MEIEIGFECSTDKYEEFLYNNSLLNKTEGRRYINIPQVL